MSIKKFLFGVAMAVVAALIVWVLTELVFERTDEPSTTDSSDSITAMSAETEHGAAQETSQNPTPNITPVPTVADPTPLERPLSGFTNISSGRKIYYTDRTIEDNYGNEYRGYYAGSRNLSSERVCYTVLLGGSFSRFQATYFIPAGATSDLTAELVIFRGDVEMHAYELTKTSDPIDIDIDVSEWNEFTLEIRGLNTLSPSSGGIESRFSNAFFVP